LFFSNIISIVLISFFIILLGIFFPNKAKIVQFLNLISAFYLLVFFYLTSGEYIYNIDNINLIFQQNYNLYLNLFVFIATITLFLFFLSICDIYYLEENMKIEYILLVFYIYIGAILLLSSLDFISIIILLECIAFSSYILVGFERKNKFSTASALKYLILASIPSGFFILGISILYNNYGSFYMDYLELLLVAFDNTNINNID
jgi:NADH-quinone oxidoreductase subunit N